MICSGFLIPHSNNNSVAYPSLCIFLKRVASEQRNIINVQYTDTHSGQPECEAYFG